MLSLKPGSAREASHHSAFMGKWPTVIHTFLASSTQWMSFPLMKRGRGVSPRFQRIVFAIGVK